MVVAALRPPTVATSEVMVSKVVRDMTVAKIRATMTTDATSPAEGIALVPRQKYARDVQAFEVAPTVRFPGRSPRLQHFVLAQIVTKAPRQAKENEARKSRRIAMALRISAFVGLVLGFTPAMAFAGERPVVVELFTSQGCSSCPPANAFLNEMSRGRPDVLPLAFHVTYWARLGWKDPFSLEAATVRQDHYGHRFGDGSYTPEIVVDGMVGLVGSHRDEVNGAIEHAKRGQHTATDVNVDKAGDNVTIRIGSGVGRGKVLLIGFDHEHTTKIGRGENGGRTLAESNVVRSIRPVGEWSGKPLEISERFSEGQDAAVVIESADGGIVGAARLSGGSTR